MCSLCRLQGSPPQRAGSTAVRDEAARLWLSRKPHLPPSFRLLSRRQPPCPHAQPRALCAAAAAAGAGAVEAGHGACDAAAAASSPHGQRLQPIGTPVPSKRTGGACRACPSFLEALAELRAAPEAGERHPRVLQVAANLVPVPRRVPLARHAHQTRWTGRIPQLLRRDRSPFPAGCPEGPERRFPAALSS